ncbi:hypothetical protein ASD24_24480 [Paenibacillus sp. Root52]|uniref:hypothetical protein n=1 Tax=Paenibacillus sp. Root52 TaxID=1736552 RepID=UPI0006FF6D50|nr:hypothetical protein [Paenibacillus sp. Root52]KQY90956.1 hypothetical protein ASD24_24480 [Paenibacillus sp. Root52]
MKKETLEAAVYRYARAHLDNAIWQRENSSSFSQAKGYMDGICTAYQLDYEIIKSSDKEEVLRIIFRHQRSGRKYLDVDANARI